MPRKKRPPVRRVINPPDSPPTTKKSKKSSEPFTVDFSTVIIQNDSSNGPNTLCFPINHKTGWIPQYPPSNDSALYFTKECAVAIKYLVDKNVLQWRSDTDTFVISIIITSSNLQRRVQSSLRIAMDWILRHTSLPFQYPYMSELLMTQSKDSNDISDLYSKLSLATPSSKEGEAFVPSSSLIPTLRSYQKAAVAWMLSKEVEPGYSTQRSIYQYWVTFNDTAWCYSPFHGTFFKPLPFSSSSIGGGGILADEMGLGKTVSVIALVLANPREQQSLRNNLGNTFGNGTSTSNDSTGTSNLIPSNGSTSNPSNLIPSNSSTSKPSDLVPSKSNPSNLIPSNDSTSNPSNLIPSDSKPTSNNIPSNSMTVHCICQKEKDSVLIACKGCGILYHQECISRLLEFVCVDCTKTQEPLPAKSTLIISPSAIHTQWLYEITRHTKNSLSVIIYDGVKSITTAKEEHYEKLFPTYLATFDIVITTYEALTNDIYHLNSQNQRNLRRFKRYRNIPSPILSLEWWRVCLDEAQMVESSTAKAATMARLIPTVHKWCVTGTPVSSSVQDLYGLFIFLQSVSDPFNDKELFSKMSLKRLVDFLNTILWRNLKSNVLEQIQLPVQNDSTIMLSFSAIESHFYEKQEAAVLKLPNADNVLRLRQACCHPQIGSNGVGGSILSSSPMTMDEILKRFIKDAKLKCEDDQRKIIAASNGLAGLYIIEGNSKKAIETYVESIKLYQSNWKEFRVDALQRLHIKINLLKQLKDCDNLSIQSLSTEIQTLRQEYMYQAQTRFSVALLKFEASHEAVENYLKTDTTFCDKSPWYCNVIPSLLLNESIQMFSQATSVTSRQYILQSKVDALRSTREGYYKALLEFQKKEFTEEQVVISGNCSVCREGRTGNVVCSHCKFSNNNLSCYKSLLYEGNNTNESSSELALVLQELYKATKTAETSTPWKLMELLQKEFNASVKVFTTSQELVSAMDELRMASFTMQLQEDDTVSINEMDAIFTLHSYQVPIQKVKLNSEKVVASADLVNSKSQLRFLKNLQNDSSNDYDCPICHEGVEKKVVLPCAHILCLACVEKVLQKRTNIKCPTCRALCRKEDCSIVIKNFESKNNNTSSNHGTKMDALVSHVQKIQNADETAKILIFTQWKDMLKLLSAAFEANNIQAVTSLYKSKWDSVLKKFKSSEVNVLGLTFKDGANGLNLTEANHVFLLEPLLDPGVEAQAVNRVHRIGQTRVTSVYRYVMRGTIEEKIIKMNKASDNNTDITMEDIGRLLNSSTSSNDDVEFWKSEVRFNNRLNVTIEEVERQLVRVRSYDNHLLMLPEGNTGSSERRRRVLVSEEPTTLVFGKHVNVYVALDILKIVEREDLKEELDRVAMEIKIFESL